MAVEQEGNIKRKRAFVGALVWCVWCDADHAKKEGEEIQGKAAKQRHNNIYRVLEA